MKKFILRAMAWLLAVAMLLPSAGAALTTAYAEEEKPAYSGSVTFSDSQWWTEREVGQSEMLGSIKPEDVSYIKFYSDETVFNIGYSGTSSDWVLGESQTSYIVSDINWSNMLFKFGLSKNDGVNYTIKWDVFTGDAKAPVAAETEGTSFAITTNSTDFGGTSKIPVSAFEKCDGGAKIVVEFTQETAPWWNLGLHSDAAGGWANLSEYITSHKCNSHGYIDTFSAGDNTITVELSAEGVEKIIKDNGGLLFQVKSMKVTKATVIPVGGAPKATATPTPKPTATPTPEPTPVPKFTTIGEQLVVTADMVSEKGELVIKDSKFDEIIVPDGLKLTSIVFDNVEAENAVIPGGADYSVELNNAKLEVLDVAAPAVEEMTYDVLVALLEAAKELQADAEAYRTQINKVVADYTAYLTAKATASKAQVKVTTGKWTEVGTLNIKGGTSLNVAEGSVAKVVVDTADAEDRLQVKLNGFSGDLAVKQEKAEGEKNTSISLNLGNSVIKNFDLAGGDGACAINSSKAKVEKMTVSGASNVSLLVDVEELVVDEATENADIRVYSDVETLAVQGNKNDIVLPASATVESATVVGNDVRIYGVGTLTNAEVTGTGANVAIFGTEVEGENSTEVPGEMQEMLPTPMPTATPVPWPEGVEYRGSITLNDTSWWTQESVAKSALLGNVDPSEVKSIHFYSEVPFRLGYNSTVYTDADGNHFTQFEEATRDVVVTDIDLAAYYLHVIITAADGINHDIIWDVYTKDVEIEKDPDIDYVGDYKTGYSIKANEFAGLTGDVTLKIDYRKVTTATQCLVGFYKSLPDYSWVFLGNDDFTTNDYEISQHNTMSIPVDGESITVVLNAEAVEGIIANNNGLSIQVCGVIIEGVTVTGTAGGETTNPDDTTPTTPTPVVGDGVGSITFAATSGWTEYEIALEDLLAGKKAEDVKSITFSSDVDFHLGYGALEKDWATAGPIKSIEVDDVKLTTGYGLKVTLTQNDNKEYTINWTVNTGTTGGETTNPDDEENPDTPDDTTPVPTPLVTEIQLNTGYAGDYNPGNTIPYTVFAQYTDSVEVTLKYVLYNGATTGKFCTANGWDDYVGSNWIDVDNTKSEVTFTLSKENVAEITEDKIAIGFKALNMVITEASITGAGTAVENALYGGDDATEHSFSAKELEALGAGNVQITFEYTSLGYWKDRVQFTDTSGSWSNLKASHFVDLAYEQDEWDYVILSGDKVTVTVSEEKINSIITNGASLNLRVNGVILDNITIEATPTPVYGVILEEEKSLATWNDSFSVAADKFANYKFDGSEKMLITYKCLETKNYSNLKYYSDDYKNPIMDSFNIEYVTTADAIETVSLTASFSALALNGLTVQGYNVAISKIEVIGGAETIWTGEQAIVSWDANIGLDKKLFSDLQFDGTEKLYVTYSTPLTGSADNVWESQIQYCKGDWSGNFGTYGVKTNSIVRTEEIVLTSDFSTIAENGMYIQGANLVITKVEISK